MIGGRRRRGYEEREKGDAFAAEDDIACRKWIWVYGGVDIVPLCTGIWVQWWIP